MQRIRQIGSYLNWPSQESESTRSKFTKVAAGVGVAGLALVSWKIVAAGALAYSAYKGGLYAYSRCFQRHEVKRETGPSRFPLDLEEKEPEYPVNAGHDAHGDQQEDRKEEVVIQRRCRTEEEIIADLRKTQADLCEEAPKNRRAIKATFDILISHPHFSTKGTDPLWVRKMLKKHSRWSKRTNGLSLFGVKLFRKIKCCMPKKNNDLKSIS